MESYNRLQGNEAKVMDILLNGDSTTASISGAITKVYTVKTTVDEYGRTGALVGVFFNASEADEAAKGQGWYGGHGEVLEKAGIILDSGLVLILQSPLAIEPNVNLPKRQAEQKQAALNKLTPDERILLGLGTA